MGLSCGPDVVNRAFTRIAQEHAVNIRKGPDMPQVAILATLFTLFWWMGPVEGRAGAGFWDRPPSLLVSWR